MTGWIDVAGWTLVHFVWQAALLLAVAAVVLRVLRHAAPETRYAAACAGLLAMLAAPLLTAHVLTRSLPPVSIAAGWRLAAPVSGSAAHPLAVAGQSAAAADPGGATPAATASAGVFRAAWRPMLVVVWVIGVTVLLLRLLGGWWRVRRLHLVSLATPPSRWAPAAARMASRLNLRRAIHVAESARVSAPLVVGWVRPVIVLPVAALTNLTPAQVDAILAHELAHVRRHDYLVNLLQAGAETLLFYHPAVWWISSRIRVEREHCCDRIAVAAVGDAVGYAEALTNLERWRITDSPFVMAATGGELLERIRRVLGAAPASDGRPGHGAAAGFGLAAVLVLLAGATHFFAAVPHDGDRRDGTGTRSAATSVDAVAWRMVFNHGESEFNLIGYTGRELIRFAYQVPDAHILGGPAWIDDETFTMAVPLAQAPAADELPPIVRGILESRFGLRTHVETRDLPVQALVLASAGGGPGPNLRVSTTECFDADAWIAAGRPAGVYGAPPSPGHPGVGQSRIVCGEETLDSSIARTAYVGITMPQLAAALRRQQPPSPATGAGARTVVDRTGLPGRYDVEIHAFLPTAALMARFPVFTTLFEPLGLPSIPTALEQQLGLSLEETTAPQEVIVIDYAERPTL